MAPAKLSFVSNLLTSKIFLTQLVTLVAMIASAAGYHVIDSPGVQEQIITFLDIAFTILFRLYSSGPVAVFGPFSTPTQQDVPAGASVVSVPAPKDQTQTTNVQQLPLGISEVEVHEPPPHARTDAVPASVTIH
jgi:hypothetical protein